MSAIRTVRVLNQTQVKTVGDTFSCLASANVGDLVRASSTISGGVDVASSNSIKRPVIGLIITKISSTVAEVLLLGKVAGFSGLTQGGTVFLSVTGTATSTPPIGSGYLQILGVAVNTDTIIFSPQLRVVRRI